MSYTPILTNTGLAEYAAAFFGGTTVNVNTMVFGDGNGVEPAPNPAQAALINQTYAVALNSTTISGNVVTFQGIIPAGAVTTTIREVGLKDANGNLIAVSAYPSVPLTTGSLNELIVNFIITVSNAASVVLNINALNGKVDTVAASSNVAHIIRQDNWIYNATGATTTGAVQIKITGLYANTLSGSMKLLISQNNTVSGAYPDYEYSIAANWIANTGFINSEATLISTDTAAHNVRFCNDGANCYIVIGEVTDVWTNLRLVVKDILANLDNPSYQPDFSFSVITALPPTINITQSVSPLLTGAVVNTKVDIINSSINASHIIRKPNWIYNNDGVITGALQIKINSLYAQTLSFGMCIQLTQDNFISDGAYPDYNFYVSGDWRNNDTAWHNTEATLNASAPTSINVRFANDGTDCFIILGDINTVWNNPRIIIQEVFQNQIVANYVIDFTISTITSLPSNINSTIAAQTALIGTPAAIALYSFYNLGGF